MTTQNQNENVNDDGERITLALLIQQYNDEIINFETVIDKAGYIVWSKREYEENYNSYNGESWESDHDNSMIVLYAALYGNRLTREEFELIVNAVGTKIK